MSIIWKTKNEMTPVDKKERESLSTLSDEDIDYSDIPATNASDWKGARLVNLGNKKAITVRVDRDILKWLKSVQPKGYQTLINAILRKEMTSHLEE